MQRASEPVPIDDSHFYPVFFAKHVEELRMNTQAQKTLRKFKIFVAPDEVEAAIEEGKKQAKLELNVSENLFAKLRQEKDDMIKRYQRQEAERLKAAQAEEEKRKNKNDLANKLKGLGRLGRQQDLPPSPIVSQREELRVEPTEKVLD